MTRPTSPKLEALHASIATAINAQHEQEIRDDIRREEEHLRTCPFLHAAEACDTIVLDRLLSALNAPVRYDGGEPLTREERIEWAIRRAPKT